MKKLLAITAAVAVMAMAGTAMAASTTLNVQATVLGTCSISGPGTLNFGLLDPAAPVDVTVNSGGISINCSNGTPYTVDVTGGLNRTLSAGTNTIPYSLTLPGGGIGTGTGAAAPYLIQGNILAAAYSGKPANIYTETVTVNINP